MAWVARKETLVLAAAMLDDEAQSLFWSPEEVTAGAVEAASPDALRDAFARLSIPTL